MRERLVFGPGLWLAAACMLACATPALAQTAAGPASSLPSAVTKAFGDAYPAATIASAKQERDNGRAVFRVDSLDKGRRRVLLYDASGKAVEVAEQVDEKELPRPVFDAIHSHRRAIFVTAMKVTRGANVEYRITVRGSRRTAMVAKPDGTVLSFK